MSEQLNSLLTEGVGIEPSESHNGASNGLSVRYSPTQGPIIEALANAQLNFKPLKKQVENAFFSTEKRKAMYADLAALIEATQQALAKEHLVVMQSTVVDAENKRAGVVSRLAHSSGEWQECVLLLPAKAIAKRWKDGVQVEYEKFDAQTIGSAITYARRYTYQSQTGVAAEEDLDGNDIGEATTGSRDAQKAVAEKKIKAAVDSGKTAALFYQFDDAAQKAYVTGDVKLMGDNKELLLSKGKWDKAANAIVTDANGLEDYKYELEQRGVIFRPLKGTEVTAALQESIAQAKAKRQPGE